MKKFLLFLAFGLFSLMMFSQENKNNATSTLIIKSFESKQFDKIVETFDQTMKTALPADKLQLVWADLNQKCGNYLKYTDITEGKIQEYDVNYVLCHFANLNLKLKLVYNKEHQIAGLFFIPAQNL